MSDFGEKINFNYNEEDGIWFLFKWTLGGLKIGSMGVVFFFCFKHLEATYNLTTTWIWMQLFWNNGFWELFYLYLFTLDHLIATVLPRRPAKIYPTEKWQNLGGCKLPFLIFNFKYNPIILLFYIQKS